MTKVKLDVGATVALVTADALDTGTPDPLAQDVGPPGGSGAPNPDYGVWIDVPVGNGDFDAGLETPLGSGSLSEAAGLMQLFQHEVRDLDALDRQIMRALDTPADEDPGPTDETPKDDPPKSGDAGDKGDKGDAGDKGDKGAADAGDKGDSGDKGDKGDSGDKGDKGDSGDKGDAGSTGDKGDAGGKDDDDKGSKGGKDKGTSQPVDPEAGGGGGPHPDALVFRDRKSTLINPGPDGMTVMRVLEHFDRDATLVNPNPEATGGEPGEVEVRDRLGPLINPGDDDQQDTGDGQPGGPGDGGTVM